MKICDFTLDMFKACALHCPLQLPKHDGPVPAASGNWWVMPAKNESVKKFTRLAKKDLFEREMRGGSYEGDNGHVMIGGHKFTFYRKGSVLVREDFGMWCEANWRRFLKEDGTERESTKPLRVEEVKAVPVSRHSLTAKFRCQEMKEPTGLIPDESWNSLYDMKLQFQRYIAEIARDEHFGQFYVVTQLNADLLAAMISHKQRNYPEAINRFLNIAAAALKAADYESRMHEKPEVK